MAQKSIHGKAQEDLRALQQELQQRSEVNRSPQIIEIKNLTYIHIYIFIHTNKCEDV
jgi:hypothetical protein